MQGYNFFNASHGGVNYTWSSIGKTQAFKDGEYPMPLVQITSQYFNKTSDTPAQSLPIYEVNPWEWGTWDDSIYGFAPLEYLGTRFVNGIVPENETCVRGYDNAGFITGSSSDIWAADNHDLSWTIRQGMKGLTASQKKGYESIIETLDGILTLNTSDHAGAGAYEPSPFYKYNSDTNPFAQDTRLTTEDGGQSGQNIPLGPLSQKKRNVDVIFAVDVGADSALNKWPNGNALIRTYQHTLGGYANDTSFPSVPDVNTFYNLGLNTHPTFFGCNASNFTEPTPLIVWLPNYPITFMANISYTASNVTYPNMDGLIDNGFNLATQANGTLDSKWSTCVGCAVLSRSLDRTGTSVPEICNECFERYCWNGTLDTTEVTHYAPSVELSTSSTSSSTTSTSTSMGASLVPVVWHVSAMLAISVFLTL